jgi:PAS domain S-box-containing protein
MTGEQRLAALLEGNGEAFYALDRDWRFTFFNRACEAHFGRGRDQVLGQVLWDAFPTSADSALGGRFKAAMASRQSVTFEDHSIISPGHWMEFRLFPTPEGIGVTFRNISERRSAERTLRTYGLLIERMTEGVSVSDEHGIIVYTNAAEDLMFGYEPGELVGRHVGIQNAYAPDENARRVAAVVAELRQRGAWEGEWLNRRKDGGEFVTQSHITAVEIEGRRHFMCVQRDITAAKRAEAALRDREAELARVQQIGQVGGLEVDLTQGFRNRRSPEYLALHGLSSDDAHESHEQWLRRVHPETGRAPRRTSAPRSRAKPATIPPSIALSARMTARSAGSSRRARSSAIRTGRRVA